MRSTRAAFVAAFPLVVLCAAAAAQDLVVQYPRAYAINYNPYIESRTKRLHLVAGWNNPATLNPLYLSDLNTCSHGLLKWRLTTSIDIDEFPLKADGFRYSDASYLAGLSSGVWHQPDGVDYNAIVRSFDLARRVDYGEIDEVLVQGAPYFGYWESTMAGYGGYWCNSGPQQQVASSKIFIMMGFNYERYIGEMLEDYGHRSESILWHVYGSWEAQPTHAWNRFTLHENVAPGNAACGNVHYAPNSESDYDWGNPRYVWSTCTDWLNNYPNLTGAKVWVNCTEWGGGDIRAHHRWWFTRFPHVAGSLTEYGMTRLNNWWEYTQNLNAHPESGGDHVPGGPAPAATPYTGPVARLTTSSGDDWRPQVSAGGRIVWSGSDGTDLEIWSAWADGTGLVKISNNTTADELPQVNAVGQVVWQSFDGFDYEIYTADADGTNVVRVTNNSVQDWHPAISATGRIVWAAFDGSDYEIFSANADGSDVRQITNNSAATGKPRDDDWPRINASNRVVWSGYDGMNFQIFSANADGTGLVQLTSNSYNNEYPQISDAGQVVWHAWISNSNAEVFAAPATGGTVRQLTSNTRLDWWPQVNAAGTVVWMQRAGTYNWEIARSTVNGGPVTYITANSTHDQYPQLDDNGRVVWQGFDGNDWEIYLLDGGQIFQLTDNTYHDRAPAVVTGGPVTWHGEAVATTNGRTTEIFAVPALDLVVPTITGAVTDGSRAVRVTFSEPVAEASATNPAHYAIDKGITVSAAALEVDGRTVRLTVSPLRADTLYTLAVTGVTDLAGNPVAPGTTVTLVLPDGVRVWAGLAALYTFEEGAGATVYDVSGVGTPLNLTISQPATAVWTTGGLRFNTSNSAVSVTTVDKLVTACQATGELTLEAWIEPAAALQGGPARIVTASNGASARNFTLGHGQSNGLAAARYEMRVRTTATDLNGLPSISTPPGSATESLQHVVFVRQADGSERIYLNATPSVTGTVGGTLANWNPGYYLALGNENNLERPWLGEFRLVAIYGRALSPAEVEQNFAVGPDPTGGPVVLPGDTNCDGAVTFDDIDPFVVALSGQAAYEAQFPDCDWLSADCNEDGTVDFDDIDPFVTRIGT